LIGAVLAILLLLIADGVAPAQTSAYAVHTTLTIESDDGTRQREGTYILRLARSTFRLEIADVCVVGTRTEEQASIVAWHRQDPTSVFIDTGEDLSMLIRRALPPIWCGRLADWMAGTSPAYPLVGRTWPSVPETQETPDGRLRLLAGAITYEPARAGSPETIQIRRADSARETLTLRYEPIEPGDPGQWLIDSGRRSRVSSIRALSAHPPAIRAGELISGLRLFGPDAALWDLRRAFEREPTARGERHAQALVLGMLAMAGREGQADPVVSPEQVVKLLGSIRERVVVLASERGVPRPPFIARPVAVFAVPDYERTQFEHVRSVAAGSVSTDALLPGIEASVPQVLWTQPPRDSIDLFTPGAQAVIVVIDSSRRLVRALRVEGDLEAAIDGAARAVLGEDEPGSARVKP